MDASTVHVASVMAHEVPQQLLQIELPASDAEVMRADEEIDPARGRNVCVRDARGPRFEDRCPPGLGDRCCAGRTARYARRACGGRAGRRRRR